MHFIGRQPILDRNLMLYGHELLFRSGPSNHFSGDLDDATRSVIDSWLLLMPFASPGTIFINCTRETLVSGITSLLPPACTVLEILDDIPADEEVLTKCRSMRAAGYRFAMHDFTGREFYLPFLEIADFIKVDFTKVTAATRKSIYCIAASADITVIAEKIETESDVELAWSEGCELFQGYFFCKPVMTRPRVVPHNQLIYMRLLAELTREPANLQDVEGLTMSEPSICYRLLRLVNSSLYALPTPVESIRGALMLIGDDEFRKLITIALVNLGTTTKSKVAVRIALERAKFCEMLSLTLREAPSTLYLLGMLSLMDVVLDMPMSQVVEQLPLHQKIKEALLGKRSSLSVALELVRARESGGWFETTNIQEKIGLPGSEASRFYTVAIQWADTVCSIV